MDSVMPNGISDVNAPWHDSDWHSFLVHPLEKLAKERFRLLVQQLEAEGRTQDDIARLLRTSQGQVSKIANGSREAGLSLVVSAVDRLKISATFFFHPVGKNSPALRYTDFVGPHKIPPPGGYEAMAKFLDEVTDITADERDAIERQRWDGEPTTTTYHLFLQALRTLKREDTAVRKRRMTPVPKKESSR